MIANNKNLHLKNLTNEQVEIELNYLGLFDGGKWRPSSVEKQRNTKIAIIVPYRDRLVNLRIFLLYMHQFLSKQNAQYGIYIVEPIENLKFNRALLINIGFLEALKENDWDCFIFHDVDMLPENPMNIYECDANTPKQMAIALNTYSYS